MSGVYRERALPAPTHTRTTFGTSERLVLCLPMSPAETAAKLAPLVRARKHRWKAGARQPFVGIVTETTIAIQPASWYGSALSVSGSLESAGANTLARLRIGVGFGQPVGVLALVLTLALVLAAGVPAVELAYYVARCIAALVFAVAASFVAVRVGIARVRNSLLSAFDAPQLFGGDDGANPLSGEEPPSIEDLHRKLEAWERKHLE